MIKSYGNASTDATTYKGNDIDSDGDGTVNAADDATNVTATYKGNDIDTDGDGIVDQSEETLSVETRSADPSSPSGGRIWIRTDL